MFAKFIFLYRFKKAIKQIKGEVDFNNITSLLALFNPLFLSRYTPKLGFEIMLNSKMGNIGKLFEVIDEATLTVRENGLQVTNITTIEQRRMVKLDDYLVSSDGVAIDITDAFKRLKKSYGAFYAEMLLKDTRHKTYYCRKYKDLFLDIYIFLQTLVEVCEK